jgi:hypothetical protein
MASVHTFQLSVYLYNLKLLFLLKRKSELLVGKTKRGCEGQIPVIHLVNFFKTRDFAVTFKVDNRQGEGQFDNFRHTN